MRYVFVILFVLTSIPSFAQEDVSFPLEIGNKYFYQAGRYPYDGLYAVTKTITDSLADGARIVSIREYYKNDSVKNKTEYWRFSNKKLSAATSLNSFWTAIFDGNIVKDTNIYNGPSYQFYKNFTEILFNQSYFCQSYLNGFTGIS